MGYYLTKVLVKCLLVEKKILNMCHSFYFQKTPPDISSGSSLPSTPKTPVAVKTTSKTNNSKNESDEESEEGLIIDEG